MQALELLAPARNADIGIAAIRCGADAVYIGGPAFGARVAASNTIEDIRRLCDFAAQYGAKIFVTVNTLCSDQAERSELVAMMLKMKDIGISAFIIQDTTLLSSLREYGPWKEEFHASTQCAIRTPERATELASMGFCRLILERQLSLGQIRAIKKAVPTTDLEFFVHGALCVCYSGDCYLSELLTGRSANRGECAQPCRNDFDLVDEGGAVLCEKKPLLSLKDFCLINRLPELAEAGVVSFKIEGRLKNESYVKNVVKAYSQALDALVASNRNKYRRSSYGRPNDGFKPDLNKTFNRGYTELFIDGRRTDWHSKYAAKYIGEAIGKIDEIGRGYIVAEGAKISNGDGLCVVQPNGDVVGFRVDKVEGKRVWCRLPQGVKSGMRIWRNLDVDFEKQLERTPQRLMSVALKLDFGSDFNPGCAPTLQVHATREDGVTHSLDYDISGFDLAHDQKRMHEAICTQLSKTSGIYSFTLEGLGPEAELPFLPASFLNGIRRDFAEIFEKTPVEAASPAKVPPASLEGSAHPRNKGELMRSKYCIRYREGLCPKYAKDGAKTTAVGFKPKSVASKLFLRNNGRLIPLSFDCSRCEMILLDSDNN